MTPTKYFGTRAYAGQRDPMARSHTDGKNKDDY